MNFSYTTRDLAKFTALIIALGEAGYNTFTLSHMDHHHIETTATAEEFAVVRASINMPSSVDVEVSSVVIPDDLSSLG